MKIEWKTCFKIGVSIFLLYLCLHYWDSFVNLLGNLISASAPLFIGCIIAYLLNILMSFYEKHYFPKAQKTFLIKSRRPVCLIAAFLTLIAAIALIVLLIVPQLTACVQILVAEIPGVISYVISKLDQLHIIPEDIIAALSAIDWRSRIEQIIGVVTSGLGDAVNVIISTVSSVISGIVTAFIAIIFSIYLLIGKDSIGRQCKKVLCRYVKPRYYAHISHILQVINECFHRYTIGQCTEAVILGVLCTVGMWILQLPYATMIGALIAFTALIPIAGAYIGGGIGAFMIFTVSPMKALIFLIFLVILQQIEGNLIYPRVVGSSTGLPGIWVLAAVTIGGGLLGITGMLLSVPIAAAVYKLLREHVNKQSLETANQG